MKRLLALTFAALIPLIFGGCFLWKKNTKPKENPALAAEMEEGFKQRYVQKRTGELVAQGLSTEAAEARALEEFRTRYGYTNAAKK